MIFGLGPPLGMPAAIWPYSSGVDPLRDGRRQFTLVSGTQSMALRGLPHAAALVRKWVHHCDPIFATKNKRVLLPE